MLDPDAVKNGPGPQPWFRPQQKSFFSDKAVRELSSTIRDSVKRHLRQGDGDTAEGDIADDDEDDDDDNDDDDNDEEDDNESDSNEEDPFALLKTTQEYEKLSEDFASRVVLAALISAPTRDLDRLTEWCYEERTEEELEHILASYCPENGAASGKQVSVEAVEAATQNYDEFSVGPDGALLSEQLAAVWGQFLDRVESLDIKECLSFQLLAGCLEDLSVGGGGPLGRRFLAPFAEGRPNLVVCAKAEMHVLALAFYLQDPGKRLPGPDEVLICQHDTPVEQVNYYY